MKPLKIGAELKAVEAEQESYGLYSIEMAFKDFLKSCEGLGRSPQTLERHQRSYDLLCNYLDKNGGVDLASIRPQTLAGFQSWLYQAKSRHRKPYSIQSQIVILNSLQVFFKYLYKSGVLLSNPAEAIELPKAPKKLPQVILTTREMKKLLAQPDASTVLGFRDRTSYEVLYSTGLRISEMIGLCVEDLNLTQGSIHIKESKHFKDRMVPLGESAGNFLSEYLTKVRPLLIKKENEGVVFLSRLGRGLDDSGVQKKLQIYGERAHIKKHLTVHVFRHTLATEMLRRGADLRQIQELLGHRSLRSTQIYTHIVKGELRRVQAHCHPREQTELPENFVRYRGRDWIEHGEL